MKLCKELLGTPSMQKLEAAYAELPSSACPGLTFDSDEYWRCVIRARAQPAARPVGTCKMGATEDPLTVTDPNLRFVLSKILSFGPENLSEWFRIHTFFMSNDPLLTIFVAPTYCQICMDDAVSSKCFNSLRSIHSFLSGLASDPGILGAFINKKNHTDYYT